jgi:hypothetical protein
MTPELVKRLQPGDTIYYVGNEEVGLGHYEIQKIWIEDDGESFRILAETNEDFEGLSKDIEMSDFSFGKSQELADYVNRRIEEMNTILEDLEGEIEERYYLGIRDCLTEIKINFC